MTWHTEVVAREEFQAFLGAVQRTGGTITSSCPCTDGYSVTYVTPGN